MSSNQNFVFKSSNQNCYFAIRLFERLPECDCVCPSGDWVKDCGLGGGCLVENTQKELIDRLAVSESGVWAMPTVCLFFAYGGMGAFWVTG